MAHNLVETLVVERGHQLSIDGVALSILDRECPFLLLSWLQTIAEGGPLECQVLIGHGALNGGRMRVAMLILHPGKGKQQAVFVSLLVSNLEVEELVALIHSATLDEFIACKDAIHDVHILG